MITKKVIDALVLALVVVAAGVLIVSFQTNAIIEEIALSIPPKNAVKTLEVEKPTSYVYGDGIRMAEELCKEHGGILKLGTVRIERGSRYYLMCMATSPDMTFDIMLPK